MSASHPKRKLRSSISQQQQKASKNARSSARQSKPTVAFGYGDPDAESREAERREREAERQRRKKERRLDELERGQAATAGWNESSTAHIPAASTSAAAIAGLLAGKQAEQTESFEDLTPQTATSASGSTGKKKQSAELKRLLTHRRGLRALLEDANSSPIFKTAPVTFVTASRVPMRYPVHRATAPICSICGYWGDAACMRCGERVCSIQCTATHDETRCERPA